MTPQVEAAGAASPLRRVRHVVALVLAALFNPFIYVGQAGLFSWIVPLAAAVGGAAILYGLYAVFFTARARAGWPRSFFLLAWVLLGLQLAGYWLTYTQADKLDAMSRTSPAPAADSAPHSQRFEFDPSTARKIEPGK